MILDRGMDFDWAQFADARFRPDDGGRIWDGKIESWRAKDIL